MSSFNSIANTNTVNYVPVQATFDTSGNFLTFIGPGGVPFTAIGSGTWPISSGGTGASTAANARINLGLGTAATTNSTAYATAVQGQKADSAIGFVRRFKQKIADGGQVRIVIVGDSNVAGAGTGSGGSFLYNDAALTGMIPLLAQKLTTVYNRKTIDSAWIGSQNVNAQVSFPIYDPRVTVTGGADYALNGLGGTYLTNSSGVAGTFTFTPAESFDSFQIIYVTASGNSTATITSNLSATVLATLNGNQSLAVRDSGVVSIGGNATSLTVSMTAGSGFPFYVMTWKNSVPSIQLLKAGWAAGTVANNASLTNVYDAGSVLKSNILGADLVIINSLTINDAGNGTSVASWSASMQSLINSIQASGADIAIASGLNLELAAAPSPANDLLLEPELRGLCARNNIPLLEMNTLWKPASIYGVGKYYTFDYRHFNATGAIDYADQYAKFINQLAS
jgi:lysophospholipase L1-like esterase